MRRFLIAFVLITGALFAQAVRGTYTVERKSALVASAEVITVQLVSAGSVTAQMLKAAVYCSVECEITLERDGTAATTTAITLTDAGTTASESEFFTGGTYNLKTVVGDTNLLWPTLLTPGLTRAATNWSIRISGGAENIDDITNGCAFDIVTKWAVLP